MGRRVRTTENTTPYQFALTLVSNLTGARPDAGIAMMNRLETIFNQDVSTYEEEGSVDTISSAQIAVVGTDPNIVYSFNLAKSVGARSGTVTFSYIVTLTHAETIEELQGRRFAPEIPSAFTGTTQAEALAARDAFFTANPSRLANNLTVVVMYTSPSATTESYVYSTSTGMWALVGN